MNLKIIKNIIIFLFLFSTGFSVSISQWKEVTNIPSPFSNIYWLDVFFLNNNPNFGWACGYGGNVIRTSDGGQTWAGVKIQTIVIDTTDDGGTFRYDTTLVNLVNQLESIHFANNMIGYTSGDGRVFKSIDGGASWKSVVDTGVFGQVWGVFFITPDVGMAIGGGCDGPQYFRRTTNGGQSWSTFTANVPETGLTDAMLYSPNGDGYASSSGWIWKTTNGGDTWFTFSKTGTSDWQEEITNVGNSFLVPFAESCMGGGNNGGWRMTTDMGKNWKQVTVPATMFGSYLLSEKEGWVCGTQEQIHYTSDGGLNWELRNCGINTNVPLDDIWFVNDTLGWVVGRGVYKFHIYDSVKPKILSDKPLFFCEGDSLLLYSDKDFNYYLWSNGDTTKSTVVYSPGKYTLYAYNNKCEFVYPDSVQVLIFPKTEFEILTSKTPEFCEGDSIKLWVDVKYKDIFWSTGAKSDSIIVKDSGNYWVTIIDTNDCVYSKLINVIMHSLPDAKIQNFGRLVCCKGDSVILQTSENYFSYRWLKTSNTDSTISNNRRVAIFHSGTYFVIVENEFGCLDTSLTVTINVLDLSNQLLIFAANSKSEKLEFDSLGLTKMVCKELNILNTSDEIVTLHDIFVAWNIEFSIPQSQLPFYLYPGDTNNLQICFRPLDLGMRRDTVFIGDTCNTHSIPLSGIGIKNIYNAEADCDVELIFKTKGVMGGEYFRLGTVYPQPAVNVCYIDFSETSKENKINASCILRNTFGITVAEGIMQNQKSTKQDDYYLHSGQWLINTESVQSGIYFLEILVQNVIKTEPVIIIK